ncbi:hypothetical protein METP3_03079 [Methanosarcinales archaeon]|nr:hypothetical protein METP3_03079 [Methanosarcinales archaeon]
MHPHKTETILYKGLYLNEWCHKLANQATIHKLIHSDKIEERRLGIVDLHHNFNDLPDKKQACEDIHRLIRDENRDLRMCAAMSLGVAFPHCTNKKQAWEDIIILIKDTEYQVQHWAANSLCGAFPYISDKKQAWKDIIQLVNDEDNKVLQFGIISLSNVFRYVDDKNQAWEDIILLTKSRNMFTRSGAVYAMGANFRYVNDKNQAWKDVHQLTLDESSDLQWNIAEILGDIFPYFPTENQILNDLNRLALDKISGLRISANYSLGRASIFKATEAENKEDFRKELENALKFFEKSANEVNNYSEFLIRNPASFCLPFYRSLYSLIFKNQTEAEVKNYLSDAKSAVEGSESKEKLLDAVKNLANALEEIQNAHKVDFNTLKCDLKAYTRYCERAAELLVTTEEKAPLATKLIKKGLPIVDERIKEIIAEIQEKAKSLHKLTLDTPLEDLGKEVNRVSQTFSQIRDPIGLEKGFINMQIALSAICAKMPDNEREEACELLKRSNDEPYIEDKISLINMILSKFLSQLNKKDMTKIQIKIENSQIALGNGNIQKVDLPTELKSEVKSGQKRSGLFNFMNISAIAATLSGFVTLIISEILNIFPEYYNKHAISIFSAIVIFTIVLIIMRKYYNK